MLHRAGKWVTAGVFVTLMAPVLSADSVGVIIDYEPQSAKIEVRDKSDGPGKPILLGMPVKAGQFIVVEGDARAMVRLVDGKTQLFPKGKNQVLPAAPLGTLDRIFNWWVDSLSRRNRGSSAAVRSRSDSCAENTRARPKLQAPSDGAKLVAGRVDIPYAWQNGCPEYVAVMSGSGKDAKEVARDAVVDSIGLLRSVELARGTYSFVLVDKAGGKSAASIQVVESRPHMPDAMKSGDAELDQLGEALWLAREGGDEWRIEAVRQILPLVDQGNGAAVDIARALLQAPE